MKHLRNASRQNILPLLGSVFVVAVIGTVLLLGSHAASPFASSEVENGATSGATKVADTTASGGSYVQFGTAQSGGGGGSNQGVPWIGINNISGWGAPLVTDAYNNGFRWDRVESNNSLADADLNAGISLILIVPTDTNGAMSWMNQYKSYGNRVVFEFGNEEYLNQSGYSMTAGQYAQAYQAARNAKVAAGITQPLLFMTTGDPCWSIAVEACNGKTFLEDALAVVPSLQVDAFSTHTYGRANEDTNNHTNGVNALLYQHQNAVSHGFTNTPWYLSEFGFTLNPAESSSLRVDSYADQAAQLTAAYNQMIPYGDGQSGTWLKGIIWYASHDDSTGWWGLYTTPGAPGQDLAGEPAGQGNNNTPLLYRASYYALKAFLTNH